MSKSYHNEDKSCVVEGNHDCRQVFVYFSLQNINGLSSIDIMLKKDMQILHI